MQTDKPESPKPIRLINFLFFIISKPCHTIAVLIALARLPKLNSTLRLAIHEPLYQRLVMNYNLERLSKEERRFYIHEKLKGAGCNQAVFHEAAVEAILNAADGTPRIINKLCNASLLIGDSSKSEIITANIAMQAINDCELG